MTSWKHYIAGGSGTIATYTRKSNGTNELHYLTRDHLGSIDSVTNSAGAVEVRLSFSSFGQRRNAATLGGNPTSGDWTDITNTTRRGFTSHEMLDNLNLTHMNGRVYDPVIGQFTSADPFIDDAGSTQGWNRYAYVHNSPLRFADPNGFQHSERGPVRRINGIEEVVTEARRDRGGAGLATLVAGLQGNISRDIGVLERADGGGDGGGDTDGDADDVIAEVVTTASRIYPAISLPPGAAAATPDSNSGSGACKLGNFLQTAAEAAGDWGLKIELAGVGASLAGFVAPDLLPIGGGMMFAGGGLNLVGGVAQTAGGILQYTGGDHSTGLANMGYGSLNLSLFGGVQVLQSRLLTEGASFSQRVFNSSTQRTLAYGGALNDTILAIASAAAPRQADCQTN